MNTSILNKIKGRVCNTKACLLSWFDRNRERLRRSLRYVPVLLVYIFFFPLLLALPPVLGSLFIPAVKLQPMQEGDEATAKRIKQLEKDIASREKRIENLTPGNAYLVVNTTENRFALYKNRELVREGMCSTGSMVVLEAEGDKSWFFRTPRGDYKVQGKIEKPVWRRPDWAFIEEGLPVPSGDHPSRYEKGVLGDYALTLGDGYMIHGTLYQRFIGLPVTHGCIRMLDDDLELVFKTLPVGAKVFIY